MQQKKSKGNNLERYIGLGICTAGLPYCTSTINVKQHKFLTNALKHLQYLSFGSVKPLVYFPLAAALWL